MININNFEDEDRYNLFRSVGELIHPVISKRNISDYNIILEEYLYPVRVYYPKKVSNIKKVIIYVHGDSFVTNCSELYSEISSDISILALPQMIEATPCVTGFGSAIAGGNSTKVGSLTTISLDSSIA